MGRKRYPKARRLLITADCGGSNGALVRLWKVELQKLANQTGLAITVTHHPPGTGTWNRIEHRLYALITQNWRGKPLLSHQIILQLIAATTTATGLDIACAIDPADPKSIYLSCLRTVLLIKECASNQSCPEPARRPAATTCSDTRDIRGASQVASRPGPLHCSDARLPFVHA
jgi:Rhodopirellula transposase DDE domain